LQVENFSKRPSVTGVDSFIPGIGEITFDRNVMNPRLESTVEKLLPVRSNLKHQRLAKKEMFVAETGSNTTEIE